MEVVLIRVLIIPDKGIPYPTRPCRPPGVPVPEPGYGSGTRVRGYVQKKDRTGFFGQIPDHTLPDHTRTRPYPYPTLPYPGTRLPLPVPVPLYPTQIQTPNSNSPPNP